MSDSVSTKASLFMLLLSSMALAPATGFSADSAMQSIESRLQEGMSPLKFTSKLQDKLSGVSTHGQKVARSFLREGCGYFAQIQVALQDLEAVQARASAVETFQEIFS